MRSLYESLNPIGTVAGQRVVDDFSGDGIRNRWTVNQVSGTGTATMSDAINDGLRVRVTSAANNNRTCIHFNSKRQYDSSGSIVIAETKRVTTNTELICGLTNLVTGAFLAANMAAYFDSSGSTYKTIRSSDGATLSDTNTTVLIDTNWTISKMHQTSSYISMLINGAFAGVKTSNLPASNTKQEPFFFSYSTSAAANKDTHIRYLEAYNT